QVDGHPYAVAAGEGERVRVERREPLLLDPIGREYLAEVARSIEEADADEGDAEIAGRLQVVAGEHAEATRVLRKGLGDPELGREVGDEAQRARGLRLVAGLEPARRSQVPVEVVGHLVQVAQE